MDDHVLVFSVDPYIRTFTGFAIAGARPACAGCAQHVFSFKSTPQALLRAETKQSFASTTPSYRYQRFLGLIWVGLGSGLGSG